MENHPLGYERALSINNINTNPTPPDDIRTNYPDNQRVQFLLLNFLRPHYGARLHATTGQNFIALAMAEQNANTSDIDTFLALLRTLLSRGLKMPPAIGKTLETAMAVVNYAWSDMGWDFVRDQAMKTQIMSKILGAPAEVTNWDDVKLNFENLLYHHDLLRLVARNEDLRFFSTYLAVYKKRAHDPRWELVPVSSITGPVRHQIEARRTWDGSEPLVDHLYARLKTLEDVHINYMPICGSPRFIYILFEPKRNTQTFKDIFRFQLDTDTVWEKDGKPVQSHQVLHYYCCAIVRLHDTKCDIRTYREDGTEIVPFRGNGGKGEDYDFNRFMQHTVRQKDLERPKRWSIEQEGRYMLFYQRIQQGSYLSSTSHEFALNIAASGK